VSSKKIDLKSDFAANVFQSLKAVYQSLKAGDTIIHVGIFIPAL
jgi:hypothetical protein